MPRSIKIVGGKNDGKYISVEDGVSFVKVAIADELTDWQLQGAVYEPVKIETHLEYIHGDPPNEWISGRYL